MDLVNTIAPIDIGEALDIGERFFYIDSVIRMSGLRSGQGESYADAIGVQYVPRSVDPGAALVTGNELFDELISAGKETNSELQIARLAGIDAKIQSFEMPDDYFFKYFFSRNTRNRAFNVICVRTLLPGIIQAYDASARDDRIRSLIGVACKVRLHETRNQELPSTLLGLQFGDDMASTSVPAGTNYRKTRNGFLVYSNGPNSVDDGGNDSESYWRRAFLSVNGEWLTQAGFAENYDGNLSTTGDDWTVMMPPPRVVWGTSTTE